ncbi:M20/M25/M40 family metallo-hydrolase [Cerasicoccus fimbriatus]|uniref:M20/M25/M40 family metallo-hydrolase n=1 Tax=Cerasicoccus fimbriatus TaxID=3014554 RepID=UPI0022B3ED68|nr:M20/M25/M40 family metallo-hydrolase [Cerasicoccus sp. TK19100]
MGDFPATRISVDCLLRSDKRYGMSVTAFRTASERHLAETLEFLRRMMDINSLTTNISGVQAVGECMAEHFTTFGFIPEFIPTKNPEHGSHLVLRRPVAPQAPTIALLTHLDTVFSESEERENNFSWRVEGDRIYGPGANDIKGGTAAIYLLLKVLREEAASLFESVNWMVLANACEEVDSDDFGETCQRLLPANTRACLIFEADGGSPAQPLLVDARKGRAVIRIDVEGRSAHAGSAHQQGANAIVALAEIVQEVSQLTNYAANLTVNVGVIEGGTVTNRVPHHASAQLEIRAFENDIFDEALAKILALESTRDGSRISTHLLSVDPPWPPNPKSQELLKVWQTAGAELGVPVASMTRGGLSDGNVLWQHFPTLDGLGPCGENCHCSVRSSDGEKDQEWVDAKSFVSKTALNALALSNLVAVGFRSEMTKTQV